MNNSLEKNNQHEEKIFSVSDYIEMVNEGLKNFRSKVVGEISEVNIGPTGHVYFALKDENDESLIRCVIWNSKYNLYGIQLKEGMKIIASGCPNLHPKYGFKFIADVIELAGEGTLKREYERLKRELEKEGVFEESKKRPIPKYPQKIGVITARQGAVIEDFLNNLRKFRFSIKMIDSRVEGQAAVVDLLSAVKTFKDKDIDVLVIMRGGGSLESMLAFNNELLVREIADFPVPVIAAIGHHKDAPLVALAADLAVSTPSIAATALSESWIKASLLLEKSERDIFDFYEEALKSADLLLIKSLGVVRNANNLILREYEKVRTSLRLSFQKFEDTFQNINNNLKSSWKGITLEFNSLSSMVDQKLKHSANIIFLNNPERQIEIGYSIVRSGGKLIKSTKEVKIGENLDVEIRDGIIISKVKNIHSKKRAL